MENVPGASGEGQMVEIEIEGEKILVPEASKEKFKGGFLGQSDYSKNMARLKTEREEFESSKNQRQELHELGMATDELLNANPKAGEILRALAEDNQDELKRIVGEKSGDKPPATGEEQIARLEQRLKAMEEGVKVTQAHSQRARSSNDAMLQARELAKEKFGISYDEELVRAMGKFKEYGNPHLVMFLAGDRERAINTAKEEGIKEGRKNAVEEMVRKSENTPPISSGSGSTGRSGKVGRAATELALAKLMEEGKI